MSALLQGHNNDIGPDVDRLGQVETLGSGGRHHLQTRRYRDQLIRRVLRQNSDAQKFHGRGPHF